MLPDMAGHAGQPVRAAVDSRFENGPLAVIDREDGQVSAYSVGGLVLDVPARSLHIWGSGRTPRRSPAPRVPR